MVCQLDETKIIKLNNWMNFFGGENNDAKHTGFCVGVETVLQAFQIYRDVIDKEAKNFEVEQATIQPLIEKMKLNSINAMWNLGLASGICWTLELFGILNINYSKCNR